MRISIILFILFSTISISLADTKELIFLSQDFKPYTHGDKGGSVAGPVAEIIKEVCSEINIVCSFRMLPWPRAQHEIQKGEANAIFVIGRTRDREQWLHYSLPILDAEYGFFVREDNPLQFNKPSDIDGYIVGVYGPSGTHTKLKNMQKEVKHLTIAITPHDESAFKKLSYGRVDAAFSNKLVGIRMIHDLQLNNIRYAGTFKKIKYYIGFSKRHHKKKFIECFNEHYIQLYRQGIITKILEPYNLKPALPE